MNQTAETTDNTLKVGDYAPEFMMPTDGEGEISLGALKGKNVVLYFYPKDDTPGCTKEAQKFTELSDQFNRASTVILGVSKDNVSSHDTFKAKYCIPFQLAYDETGTVCEAYGTWVEKSMYGKKYMGIQRDTFLINDEGKIAAIWRKVKVEGHAQEVLEAARKLR
ncbi:MAG: peroxiredoxin [Hyphomicrobiales bacterium]|nr:peroxiredoxin [Hyphomicrobiales bacterium]